MRSKSRLTLKSKYVLKKVNKRVIGITNPLIKLGTVVVTVALRFVPNCSDAEVLITAHNPTANPTRNTLK